MPEKTSRFKPLFFRIGKLVIITGVLAFLILYVKPVELWRKFQLADFRLVVLAVVLLIPNLFFQYLKWAVVSKRLLGINHRTKVAKSLFYGIGAGMFTPMKIGELFARAIPFKDYKISSIAFSSFFDKLISQFIVLVFGLAAMVIFYRINEDAQNFISHDKLILLFAGLTAVILVLVALSPVRNRIFRWLKEKNPIRLFLENIKLIRGLKFRTLLLLAVLAVVFHLTFTIQMSLLLGAFSRETTWGLFFLIANLIVFTQVIISPIGLGEIAIREGVTVFYCQVFGIAGAIGFNAAFLLFFINLVIPSIAGLVMLVRDRK